MCIYIYIYIYCIMFSSSSSSSIIYNLIHMYSIVCLRWGQRARGLLGCGRMGGLLLLQSISEISSSLFWGRDPGTLKSNIVSNEHPQLICSDLRLSN